MLCRKAFAKGMAALAEVFNKEVSELKANVYYHILSDLTDDEFRSAVATMLTTKKYPVFPLPAEILDAARGDAELLSAQALEKMERAMHKVGSYRSVVFDDPLIHRVIGVLGGWDHLCRMPTSEWEKARREFGKLYVSISRDRSSLDNVPVRLVGINDRHNVASGYSDQVPPPVIVGDKEKALAWTRKVEDLQKSLADRVRPALGAGGSGEG